MISRHRWPKCNNSSMFLPLLHRNQRQHLLTKLNQLAQLHQSGILTDEEFTAAKQKLLAS
jgi:hypothetical protein